MSKAKGCLIALIGVPLAFVAFLWLGYPSYKWHQKLVVAVETPEGVKMGASVVRVSVYNGPTFGLPDASGSSIGWRGEATIIELPNKRFLFVLLGEPVAMAQDTFKAAILGSEDVRFPDMDDFFPKLNKLRGRVPLAKKRYPMLVTFTDINNPASVKLVDPANLDAAFGCPSSVAGQTSEASASPQTDADPQGPADDKPCYSLKSITLEITDEPVTTGKVESVLGWIWTHAGHLSGQNNEDHSRPELNTTIGDFLKGIKK